MLQGVVGQAPPVTLLTDEWDEVLASCTARQVQCLDLWRRHYGYKRIGLVLGLHPSTAKAHVEAGLRNIGHSIGHYAWLR